MAKLASQTIVIQICKAVPDSASDEVSFLNPDAIAQLVEAIEALADDSGVVVEVSQ